MNYRCLKFGVVVSLVGIMLAPASSWAQKKTPAAKVRDDAKLFSNDGLERVKAVIAEVEERHHKELRIDTLEKGVDRADMPAWALKRFDNLAIDGVYVVITVEPRHFRVVFGKKTGDSGLFTQADLEELVTRLRGLGKNRDEVILDVAKYTLAAMDKNAKAHAERQKLLLGKWHGPAIELAEAKGHVYLNIFEEDALPFVSLGYDVNGRKVYNTFVPQFREGLRQMILKEFEGEKDLVLTYEVTNESLKISGAREVAIPDVLGRVKLNGTWKRMAK